MLHMVIKYVHVLGAAVLLGTGAGIAFFMLMAHATGKAATVAGVARIVVLADFVFTATAAVLQPVTGLMLAWTLGYPLDEAWIRLSILLYAVVAACWLPVLRIQMRLRDLAGAAAASGEALPGSYHRLFRVWIALGIPAFAAMLAIYWLMIARPALT